MSRSQRKSPFRAITNAPSDKEDKSAAHRRIRRVVRLTIDEDSEILPLDRELSNPWSMDKDGKRRFDPAAEPKNMRK